MYTHPTTAPLALPSPYPKAIHGKSAKNPFRHPPSAQDERRPNRTRKSTTAGNDFRRAAWLSSCAFFRIYSPFASHPWSLLAFPAWISLSRVSSTPDSKSIGHPPFGGLMTKDLDLHVSSLRLSWEAKPCSSHPLRSSCFQQSYYDRLHEIRQPTSKYPPSFYPSQPRSACVATLVLCSNSSCHRRPTTTA